MTPGDQRTIEELITLYELEPQLRDIYVEGPTDVSFIGWFLDQVGKDNVIVYDISTVDISVQVIQSHSLENNNRDRVIALAIELESRLVEPTIQVTCIVDRDFDLILNKEYECNLLLFTDYTSIEMYLYCEKCLDKFINLYLRGFPFSAGYLLARLSSVLQEVFLIRLANKLLGLELEWMTFERCCHVDRGEVVFDADVFVTRYLNKNSVLERQGEFRSVVDTWRSKLTNESRCQMHGHDFISLLAWYIAKHGVNSKLARPEIVERTLFSCIELKQIADERLFQSLAARF